jgi:hypothetical protein
MLRDAALLVCTCTSRYSATVPSQVGKTEMHHSQKSGASLRGDVRRLQMTIEEAWIHPSSTCSCSFGGNRGSHAT